ncbi:hypothetical protein [Kosakonia phage Kc304]|nr:hypothetical protein [Kosakonia phage Kc304]
MLNWKKNSDAIITSPFADCDETTLTRYNWKGNDFIRIEGNELNQGPPQVVLSKQEAQALVNYLTSVIPSMKDAK